MDLLERGDALAAMAAAWDRAGRGTGGVVVVRGEPGIGKSALVAHFTRELGPAARVLVGACDDLTTPRPLGPIRDLAGLVAPALSDAVRVGAPPHEIQRLLVAELDGSSGPVRPTLLVIEDVHWADDATLDAISVIGRRIGRLPALLVLTLRSGEVPPDHPIHAALGAIPPAHAVHIPLAPLSVRAVATLAGDHAGASALFDLTGGNPFYVSEVVAARSAASMPASIATAVLARASRLGADARRLLELVSVVPSRIGSATLDTVLPGWAMAAEEPERRGLLEIHPSFVRFRHELARHAIRASIPAARRRRLHAAILTALLAVDADPADLVHHATAAGADDVVAAHVLVAARRAAALGSNRQAFDHYQRAAEVLVGAAPRDRAAVLEELAGAAYLVARLDAAFAAIGAAIAIHRELGEEVALARCLRLLSRLHWYAGDGLGAERAAHDALAILEPLGDSAELARAYSAVSQLAMLAEDVPGAIRWGQSAMVLASRLADDGIRAHAMINIGTARLGIDPAATAELLEAHEIAAGLGDHHEATRALGNVAYSLMTWVRPAEATAMAQRALDYAESHEVDPLARYLALVIGRMQLRTGRWTEVEGLARRSLERDSGVAQLLARTILAEIACRRGEPDAARLVADLLARAERTGEPQRIEPALELATQAALFDGGPAPEAQLRTLLARLPSAGRFRTRTRAWMAISGLGRWPDETADTPHAALARGDWLAAADGFGAVGWTYDRAIALTLLDDPEALGEALETARNLESAPLARRAMGRLRALGVVIPRGKRARTRANPAGLTERQIEVLGLLVEGATNREIADRLVLSLRTVEHHVADVLGKLDAPTRREAARRAVDLGLVPNGGPARAMAEAVSGG